MTSLNGVQVVGLQLITLYLSIMTYFAYSCEIVIAPVLSPSQRDFIHSGSIVPIISDIRLVSHRFNQDKQDRR